VDSAVARFDWGRWVADCPNPACTNAMQLDLGQAEFACRFLIDEKRRAYGGCGTTAPIDWPDDPAAIEAGLAGLPEGAQNWKPEAADV
jgi:hypothetical protein